MSSTATVFILCIISQVVLGGNIYSDDHYMHPNFKRHVQNKQDPPFEDAEFWRKNAQDDLAKELLKQPIEAQAKNVILFLGDGMSIPTVTAARIFKGQKVDGLPFGEEGQLHMDTFPFSGTSKTFCMDTQVADSACSATAYLCGTKGRIGTIGVTSNVMIFQCAKQADPANHVSSVLAWAQAQGKSTGIVTTTGVTHASPAGTYAHAAFRSWESDADVRLGLGDPKVCEDIATQLIKREPGININVILGGGRRHFTPFTQNDTEYPDEKGHRLDGVNLIDEWISMKNSSRGRYVSGRDQLLTVDPAETDYLLGLFAPSHVSYYDQQLANNDPTLEEMTEVAIKILSKNPNGFFLFVEGGRIDHSHHNNAPQKAMWETIEFDKAIKKGDDMTEDDDTLIVTTADHSHVMYFAGYPDRGTPIWKHSSDLALDGLPYSTLGYANGGNRNWLDETTNKRHNISQDNMDDLNYNPPVPVPMIDSESHGGDDVAIFAKGPFAHLLTGVHQQSYIPHVIGSREFENGVNRTTPHNAKGV
ncbi:alkaline phosphatase isoform X2 [Folsomia candida]|uniref:alkaline phosphatase isoform X2 n=1 Tax=Folsomia candida TaxID=158441 RepID=UPI000B8FF00B|nr:alkaline phosphatase isoform X2 [Folsomia candida]